LRQRGLRPNSAWKGSDAYGLMQSAGTLAGIEQVPLSFGPVPQGEIARIIREPSEVLRLKAGPPAPIFDAAIVERLQNETAGEMDALPLLAFVLQRLMSREAPILKRASSRGTKEKMIQNIMANTSISTWLFQRKQSQSRDSNLA